MKNSVTNPVSYELENQRKNVAETFYLLLVQCYKLVKTVFVFLYETSFVQKTIQVVQLTSVLTTTLYAINFLAMAANFFAAAFGGTPGSALEVQYQIFIYGLWFIPVTAYLSVSFFKKNF